MKASSEGALELGSMNVSLMIAMFYRWSALYIARLVDALTVKKDGWTVRRLFPFRLGIFPPCFPTV